jgi:predicted acetyltransferase
MALQLIWGSLECLPSYVAALERHWSNDEINPVREAEFELAYIAEDPARYIAGLVYRNAEGGPIVLPDGSSVPRLPGYWRWMWDGEFCGLINIRWQEGNNELPSYCLGHIGYNVVPWKRGNGYATQALRQLLPEVKNEGLRYVELTTDVDNIASQHVIQNNGGMFVECFTKPPQYGGGKALRYRIELA